MDLEQCIRTRRSIRRFQQREVSQQTIKQLIETAIFAPSWKNSQVTRYIAIVDPKVKQRLADSLKERNKAIITSAPAVIVSTVVRNRCGYNRDGSFETLKGKGWQMYDCALSNYALCLAAMEIGLGTCILGIYDEAEATRILNIPDEEEIVALIPVGYPDESPEMPKRKSVDDIVRFI
ncbi:MAG: Nitroreductase [Oscillospiraceae bacterium]|nr:Nitroreductase [Oscillospiraceae bacterium]